MLKLTLSFLDNDIYERYPDNTKNEHTDKNPPCKYPK